MNGSETGCEVPGLGPEAYARWRASPIGAITERLERALILDLAGDVRGLKVLDVGCGDGELAVELARRGAVVTGVDFSPAMIAAARQRADRERLSVDFRAGTAEQLPFPQASFDLVTAITILCFVDDARPVFKEMARVLRPGGRLVIGELGRRSTWAAGRRIRAWLGSPLWRLGRFRTATELARLAEEAGLGVECVRGAVYYPRWAPAARLLSPFDSALGRSTTVGAAFIALCAVKPAGQS